MLTCILFDAYERLNFVPELREEMITAVYKKDWSKVQAILDTAESMIVSDSLEKKQEDQLELLNGYLKRNWDYILGKAEREKLGKNCPIGTSETNHRKITYRMKRQGRKWSEQGAKAMVFVIDAKRNKLLYKALNVPEAVINKQKELSNASLENKQYKPERINRKTTHVGVKFGSIGRMCSTSSPNGQLAKSLRGL